MAIESTALYSVDMERFEFCRDALRLSYLDWGGNGRVLIALHAHVMEALTFAPLAAALAPEWRVVALDQRGHGYSDHASSYSRNDYISDLEAFVDHLGLTNFILLGNSLGGVNAYQFAARNPTKVRGLIVEDIGAEVWDDLKLRARMGRTVRDPRGARGACGATIPPISHRLVPRDYRRMDSRV